MKTKNSTTKRVRKPVILPKKPSKLIRLALKDLRKCEAMPDKYKIDMGLWLSVNSHCTVCLAGAVLAQRLKGKQLAKKLGVEELQNWNFSEENKFQLHALDYFRRGSQYDDFYFKKACALLEVTTTIKLRPIVDYAINPEQFHADMEQLAADFEKEGN